MYWLIITNTWKAVVVATGLTFAECERLENFHADFLQTHAFCLRAHWALKEEVTQNGPHVLRKGTEEISFKTPPGSEG